MSLFRRWWFWVILAAVLYLVLAFLGVAPGYQCGSTMGPEGPVSWCQWSKGALVG